MKKGAQATIEYMLLLAIIASGLIAMRVYLKRSLQGRLRMNAEQLSEGAGYSPKAVLRGFSRVATTARENSASEGDVSTSNATVERQAQQQEELLPLEEEPKRW
jgi:Flp pilus assembly pilin Flp